MELYDRFCFDWQWGWGTDGALATKSRGFEALVLEKREVIGGSTAQSGGILWIPNDPLESRRSRRFLRRRHGLLRRCGGRCGTSIVPAKERSIRHQRSSYRFLFQDLGLAFAAARDTPTITRTPRGGRRGEGRLKAPCLMASVSGRGSKSYRLEPCGRCWALRPIRRGGTTVQLQQKCQKLRHIRKGMDSHEIASARPGPSHCGVEPSRAVAEHRLDF